MILWSVTHQNYNYLLMTASKFVQTTETDVKAGVFKGCIFGLEVFSFYINKIFKLNLIRKVQFNADETCVAYGEFHK